MLRNDVQSIIDEGVLRIQHSHFDKCVDYVQYLFLQILHTLTVLPHVTDLRPHMSNCIVSAMREATALLQERDYLVANQREQLLMVVCLRCLELPDDLLNRQQYCHCPLVCTLELVCK